MPGRTIDLHTHSLASDGSDAPAELARKAARTGLAAFALTDHDTMDGLAEAGQAAAGLGLEFVPGIEIAVRHDFDELHLMGLWMPEPSQNMRTALQSFQNNRLARNQAMLDALKKLGMPLHFDDVAAESGGRIFGRPHIAKAMLRHGYVTTRKEAFERYLGWGAKAFVPRRLPGPEEGIALLRGEGALVVLAHPCLSPLMNKERLDALLGKFKACGLNAVEAWHSAHNPEQTRLCVDLAAKHGLLLTGGSDYHGLNKKDVELGSGRGNLRIPYAVLEKLRALRDSLKQDRLAPEV